MATSCTCDHILRMSTYFLAHVHVRYLLSPVRLSVVCLWTDVHRKFYGDRLRGTPPSGELNAKGVVKYSDFEHNEGYISETVQDMRKLLLITNRKSHMSFRLVPKSVTSNDHERRSGRYFRYFSEIGSIRGALRKSG